MGYCCCVRLRSPISSRESSTTMRSSKSIIPITRSRMSAATRTKLNQFVWKISRHAVSEELVLYPLISSQGDRGKELADQSCTDHQQTKNILEEPQNITDPNLFDQKVDQMMTELREHIKKEEREDLVYLQENVSQTGREAAGTTFHLGKNLVCRTSLRPWKLR